MSKTIFITGGATGIGRASVKKFLDEGWNVGFMDINAKEANNIFNETDAADRLLFIEGSTLPAIRWFCPLPLQPQKERGCLTEAPML